MIGSVPSFPEYRDENGTAPLGRQPVSRPQADSVSGPSFQEELAKAASAPPAPPASPPHERIGVAVFRNESGGPEFLDVADSAGTATGDGGEISLFAEGNAPSVWDLLDFVNPLQHIPVVNTIYREMTGDQIGALPRLVGGTILGGPIGAAVVVANLVVEAETGRDVGEHVMAMLRDEPTEVPDTMIAAAPAEAAPTASAPADTGALPIFASEPAQAADIGAPGRFMPLPPRASMAMAMAPAAPPTADTAAAMPLPSASPVPSPEAVRVAAAHHPIVTNDTTQAPLRSPGPMSPPAASAPAAFDPNSREFVSRFMEAMDKYDRARTLGVQDNP